MLHLNHYEVKKMHNWYLHKKVIDNLFDRINTLEYQTLLKGCIFSYLINYDNPYDILLKYLKPSLNNHDKSLVYGLFSGAIIDSINTNVRCINLSFDQKMIESENEFIEELNKEIISSEIRNYDGKTVDGDVGEISEFVGTVKYYSSFFDEDNDRLYVLTEYEYGQPILKMTSRRALKDFAKKNCSSFAEIMNFAEKLLGTTE